MHEEMSPGMRRRLKTLGDDLRTARRKRRMSQADLASRIGVSTGTVKRLEAGDPGVAIGTLAMTMLAYGKVDRLANLLPEEADDIGLWIDRESLPQRIRKRKRDPEAALF